MSGVEFLRQNVMELTPVLVPVAVVEFDAPVMTASVAVPVVVASVAAGVVEAVSAGVVVVERES